MKDIVIRQVGNSVLVIDSKNHGELRVTYTKEVHDQDPECSPNVELMNDLNEQIYEGELLLTLYGFNKITLSRRTSYFMRGEVTLNNSHLKNPDIFNSTINGLEVPNTRHCKIHYSVVEPESIPTDVIISGVDVMFSKIVGDVRLLDNHNGELTLKRHFINTEKGE